MRLLFGDCALDVERRELRRSGAPVHVEPQVFDLLLHLIRNRKQVVSKEQLLAAVWDGRTVSDSALSTRINAARQAIGDSGERQQFIQTIARRGFRFVAEAEEVVDQDTTPVAMPERPSIAVMAFANLGEDPEQSYFAEGMAEDLITSLSHIRWLTVIARNSSFSYKARSVDTRQIGRELGVRYILDGSVRRAADVVRITAQLLEAETGAHLWAGKFDGDIKHVFSLQDQITANVIGAIEPSLRSAEVERANRKRPDDLNAYDFYLRALPHAYANTRAGCTQAIELLGKALAIDPAYAEAHGLAAWCHIQRIWNQSAELSADLARALVHAKAVMAIRTNDASTLAFAANAYARATRDYETATHMIEHALAQNPSNAHALAVGAVVSAWAGRQDQAILLSERALRCSPFDPVRHLALAAQARARLFEGDNEAALAAARRAAQATPGHLPSHGYVIISLVRLGRAQELRTTIEQLLTSFPNLRLASFLAHATFAPFTAELSAAGLPA